MLQLILLLLRIIRRQVFRLFDDKVWRAFKTKVAKVMDQLHDGGIKASFLGVNECRDYADRFLCSQFP